MTKVKKSVRYNARSSSSSDSSLSSDEETDVRDLKPIKDYLSDRKELSQQLFKSVKPEKVRMMLPQVLKKMDLSELQEWCSSELSGMSKKRILSILNGQPMIESSDTSETDDSGPSLEIISDTEEWLTDEEMIKNEDGPPTVIRKTKTKKDKAKIKSQSNKKNEADKSKVKSKTIQKDKSAEKQKEIKVKKEGEKEQNKGKEGDSLLDLLELEMRARAIRALIRKEEDIIPDTTTNKNASISSTSKSDNQNQLIQEEQAAKENCRKQLEKIITSKKKSTGDDEDVVLVVQPTPTIELLSSESENEGHSKKGIVAQQKSTMDTADVYNNTEENATSTSKQFVQNKGSCKDTDRSIQNTNIDSRNNCKSALEGDRQSEKRKSRNLSAKNRKRLHIGKKEKDGAVDNSGNTATSSDSNITKSESVKCTVSERIPAKEETKELVKQNIENESINKALCESSTFGRNLTQEDDRSADLGEIIDLDDYPDDMDDMDTNEASKSKAEDTSKTKSDTNYEKLGTTETWATRYYQTDDVQNVIKESKIQSEIRKRLRERQRLSKLNNSPNTNAATSTADSASTKLDSKPTGSVEEYWALGKIQSKPITNNVTNTTANKEASIESHLNNVAPVNKQAAESTVDKSDVNDVTSASNGNSESESSLIRGDDKGVVSTTAS